MISPMFHRFVIVAAAAGTLNTAQACMVCLPMPRTTAADRLIDAQIVAFAREDPQQPFSYRAVEVLKGNLDSPQIDLFVNTSTRRQLNANKGLVVVLVRGSDQSWRTIGIADLAFQSMVRRVLAFAAEWRGELGVEKRCQFFLPLISHQNRALFELAYLEMGRAPYSKIKRVAGLIPQENLQRILTQPEYIEWRPLAILMLAQDAGKTESSLVKSRLDQCSRLALTTNLAAWATAYIEIDGAQAIATLNDRYLCNPNRHEEEVRAVVAALSVHGRGGHIHLRDRIVSSYGAAIKHHPLAIGLIFQDLADWRRLDYQLDVRTLLDREGRRLKPVDRLAIRKYLALQLPASGDSTVIGNLDE